MWGEEEGEKRPITIFLYLTLILTLDYYFFIIIYYYYNYDDI